MIKQNEKEYFRQVYERQVDDIYRLCFSYLKNTHDCEDAVSVVFCRLMQKNPTFDSTEHEKAWLIVTACNECKSMLRKKKRHQRVDISDIPEHSEGFEYERCEMLETIVSLDGKYSSILYLHYYLGYSLTDIAKMTKQNVSTVRSRLFYGKKKLASFLGGNDDERVERSNGNALPIGGAEKQNV